MSFWTLRNIQQLTYETIHHIQNVISSKQLVNTINKSPCAMILGELDWIVIFILIATPLKIGARIALNDDYDYLYIDPGADETYTDSDDSERFHKYLWDSVMAPRDAASVTAECDPIKVAIGGVGSSQAQTTAHQKAQKPAPQPAPQPAAPQPAAPQPAPQPAPQQAPPAPVPQQSVGQPADGSNVDAKAEEKAKQLQILVQHLYIAEARVQLEANEIKRAQAVAAASQEQLEEASNHVRVITAALSSAQQEVAAAAIRAQTAQLQLAAHDQLLFAARQNVDALSSQMVGLQAEAGIVPPKSSLNLPELLAKLKKPLAENEKPTPVPAILPPPKLSEGGKATRMTSNHFW